MNPRFEVFRSAWCKWHWSLVLESNIVITTSTRSYPNAWLAHLGAWRFRRFVRRAPLVDDMAREVLDR